MLKIESHIADVRINLMAGSLEGLFSEGIKGLYAVLRPIGENKNQVFGISVHLSGPDKTILLIDFLNEVLSHSLVNRCVYKEFTSFRLQDNTLKASISGYKIRSFRTEVKAVTFHEAEIIEISSGMLQTTIILDI
jgi:SHS2 domain-containing protein